MLPLLLQDKNHSRVTYATLMVMLIIITRSLFPIIVAFTAWAADGSRQWHTHTHTHTLYCYEQWIEEYWQRSPSLAWLIRWNVYSVLHVSMTLPTHSGSGLLLPLAHALDAAVLLFYGDHTKLNHFVSWSRSTVELVHRQWSLSISRRSMCLTNGCSVSLHAACRRSDISLE